MSSGHKGSIQNCTKQVPENTNKTTDWKQHYDVKLSLASLCLKQATVGEVSMWSGANSTH